jgi:hypothetical protein
MKEMTDNNGKVTRVLLVDSHSEVMELNTMKEAKELAELMETNSDSGWKYNVVSPNSN